MVGSSKNPAGALWRLCDSGTGVKDPGATDPQADPYTAIMSTKAVIIALIVALALGVGAYVLLQPHKPAAHQGVIAAGELVCPFDPSRLNRWRSPRPGRRLSGSSATAPRVTGSGNRPRSNRRGALAAEQGGSGPASRPVQRARDRERGRQGRHRRRCDAGHGADAPGPPITIN